MFGIGFQELVLLSLIGLIVLGPERLPRVANQIGGWLGQARRMTRVMKRQLEDEINFEKDLNIKPPSREPSTQPPPATPNDDDTYSAAHEDGEPGTGVGDSGESDSDEPKESAAEPGDIETASAATAETADADVVEAPDSKETS